MDKKTKKVVGDRVDVENKDRRDKKRNEEKKVQRKVTEVKEKKMNKVVKVNEVIKIKTEVKLKEERKMKKEEKIEQEMKRKEEKIAQEMKMKQEVKYKVKKKIGEENKIKEEKIKKELKMKVEQRTEKENKNKEEKMKKESKIKEKKEIKKEVKKMEDEVKIIEDLNGRREILKNCIVDDGENKKKDMNSVENTKGMYFWRDGKKSFGWNLNSFLLRTFSKSDTKIRPSEWFEEKPMKEEINFAPEETSQTVTPIKLQVSTPDLEKNKPRQMEKPFDTESEEANLDPDETKFGIDETTDRCDDEVVQIFEGTEFEDIGSRDKNPDLVMDDCKELQDDIREEQSPRHLPGFREIDWDSTDADETDFYSHKDEVVDYTMTDIQKVQLGIESEGVRETVDTAKESSGIIEGEVKPLDLSKLDRPGEFQVKSIDSWVVHTKKFRHQRIRPHRVQETYEPDDDEFGLVFGVLSSLDKIAADYQESLSRPATPAIKSNKPLSLAEVESNSDSDSIITLMKNPKYESQSNEGQLDSSEESEITADGSEKIISEIITSETLQGQQGSETFVSSASVVKKTDKSSSKGFFRKQFVKCRNKIGSAWKWIRRRRKDSVDIEGSVPPESKGSETTEGVEEVDVHSAAAATLA